MQFWLQGRQQKGIPNCPVGEDSASRCQPAVGRQATAPVSGRSNRMSSATTRAPATGVCPAVRTAPQTITLFARRSGPWGCRMLNLGLHQPPAVLTRSEADDHSSCTRRHAGQLSGACRAGPRDSPASGAVHPPATLRAGITARRRLLLVARVLGMRSSSTMSTRTLAPSAVT